MPLFKSNSAERDALAQAAAISRSQAVIEFKMDGTIITANQNFLDAMGYRLDEIQGKHHQMFAPPELRGSEAYKAFWANFNRGKRSIALNLKAEQGREIAEALVRQADVLVQNYRPHAMERLGLGPDDVRKLNPKLVYLSVIGFSSTGPNRERLGFDVAAQAESGMMSLTGERQEMPLRIGYPVVDVACTHIGAEAVLGALVGRSRTGKGSNIEISMFDVAVHLQNVPLSTYLDLGIEPVRSGNGQPYNAPSADVVEATDGQVVISAYPDEHWARLCNLIERPDLVSDERFISNDTRVAHRPAMLAELNDALASFDAEKLARVLADNAIVGGVVRTYPQLVESDEFIHGRFVVDSLSADGRRAHAVRPPYQLSENPLSNVLPGLGEHTLEVLAELGFDQDAIDRLQGDDVVRAMRST